LDFCYPSDMVSDSRAAHRPLKFETVEDLEIRINQYFDDCDQAKDTRVFEHDYIDENGSVWIAERMSARPC